MKQKSRASGTLALLGSLAVHAGIAGWVMTREAPPRHHAPEPVAFEIQVSTPTEVAAPAADEPDAPPEETKSRSNARTRAPRAAPTLPIPTMPAPVEVVTEPAPVAVEDAQSPPDAQPVTRPAPRRIDLSPLAAALTMRDTFARTTCGALSDAGACEATSQGASGVRKAAPDARDALIALRKELKLTPEADGSYSYDAPSFAATVQPDGRVLFQDKIRDLNSLVEKLAGSQVNTAEKRRFMESTAALRDQLANATEAQNQERAKHTLRATLERLWRDQALTLVQKRAAVFGLWDDCASDASGTAAQASIEGFVRNHMPDGTPLAYSATELAQLNRRRVSRRSFDPYASADAGTQPG